VSTSPSIQISPLRGSCASSGATRTDVRSLLIVGLPRGGTTLLSSLLGGGAGVISLSEPYFARTIMPHWRLNRVFRRIEKHHGLKRLPPPRDIDVGSLWDYLTSVTSKNGMRHLVVKETFRFDRSWKNIDDLNQVADRADCTVVITRHPIDAAVSTLRFCRFWKGWIGRLVRLWIRGLPLFETPDDLMEYFAENYIQFEQWRTSRSLYTLRYEDLARNPNETLRGLCDHCGLAFDERMTDPNHPRTAFGGIGAPEVVNRKPRKVGTGSIDRSSGISEKHRAFLRICCAESAAAFGYSL